MSTTTDIREIAVATDTVLAGLYTKMHSASSRLTAMATNYGRMYSEYRNSRYSPPVAAVMERLEEDIANGDDPYGRKSAGLEDLAAGLEELSLIRTETEEAEEPYRRAGGWSRFYLVTNVGGHIHRSLSCSTCRYDTSFAWLPELSGLTEADAVEAYGSILCSVCFPSAPVEWTNGVSKAVAAAREERERAKAEREAKREAKRLVPGSDDGIVVGEAGSYRERIKTVAAAKTFLTDGYLWGWNHPSYSPTDRDAVAAALLGRPGVKEASVEEILAAAEKRAAKKRR
jgi:hypothetical protein